jgi:NADH:ubiquinone oxidoreductase subunit F (NADH-binding)
MTKTVDTSMRLLYRSPGSTVATDLVAHTTIHGPLAVPKGDDPPWAARIRRAVDQAGITGRGGGHFPAATKWAAAASSRRRPVLVVNAMEGEPASAKDRVLLTYSPHLVLDGAEVVAAAIGAHETVICVPDERGAAATALESALAERARAGGSSRRVSIVRPPGRYLSGEESALVAWLNDRPGLPSLRLDKAVPLTLGRRNVLLHNAETVAHVALIARHGPEWFRQAGRGEATGTFLVTVTGAVREPGVVEVEAGTPVDEILLRTGVEAPLSGVLVGGYGGAWLSPSRLNTPYTPSALAAAGATLGAGVVIALPTTSCGIAETARVARYMAGQGAGQCGPCVFGLPALADDLELLWRGQADGSVPDRLRARAATIDGRGACRHPDGVVRLVRTALEVFADDVHAHVDGRLCAGHDAPTVLTFPAASSHSRSR